MSLRTLFRRTPAPPPPAPVITTHDALVKNEWGLSLAGWLALTDQERATLRRNVTYALRPQEKP